MPNKLVESTLSVFSGHFLEPSQSRAGAVIGMFSKNLEGIEPVVLISDAYLTVMVSSVKIKHR